MFPSETVKVFELIFIFFFFVRRNVLPNKTNVVTEKVIPGWTIHNVSKKKNPRRNPGILDFICVMAGVWSLPSNFLQEKDKEEWKWFFPSPWPNPEVIYFNCNYFIQLSHAVMLSPPDFLGNRVQQIRFPVADTWELFPALVILREVVTLSSCSHLEQLHPAAGRTRVAVPSSPPQAVGYSRKPPRRHKGKSWTSGAVSRMQRWIRGWCRQK